MTELLPEPAASQKGTDASAASARLHFAMEQLKLNPEISFDDMRARALLEGLKLHPISYLSAQERLGLRARRKRAHKTQDAEVGTGITHTSIADKASREAHGPQSVNRAPSRTRSPEMEFTLDQLRTNPQLSFRQLETAATQAALVIHPAVFGKARTALGLDPLVSRRSAVQLPLESVARQNVGRDPRREPMAVERAPVGRGRAGGQRGRPLGAAMTFMLDHLRRNSNAAFSEVQKVAAAAGINVTQTAVSRARTRLGIARNRGARPLVRGPEPAQAKEATQAVEVPPRLGGARSAGKSRTIGLQAIDDLVVAIRALEADRDRLRTAVEAIATIIGSISHGGA